MAGDLVDPSEVPELSSNAELENEVEALDIEKGAERYPAKKEPSVVNENSCAARVVGLVCLLIILCGAAFVISLCVLGYNGELMGFMEDVFRTDSVQRDIVTRYVTR